MSRVFLILPEKISYFWEKVKYSKAQVNWSASGPQSPEDSIIFAKNIIRMALRAKKLNEKLNEKLNVL